jgi:formylglycine-generating enzyme required for sulfatase activity
MVSDFRLDDFEVTVSRFRSFVQAGLGTQLQPPAGGAGAHPKIANSGWSSSDDTLLTANTTALKTALASCASGSSTWSDLPSTFEEKPINCVSWHEAFAFCAWDGGRLPTVAEWTYAAAGGSEQRAYPWGAAAPDLSHADYCAAGANMCSPAKTSLASVGSLLAGVGKWSQSDLVGNVWEWGLDWIGTMPAICTDCANLTPGTYRYVFGGSYFEDVSYVSSYAQYGGSSGPRSGRYGFRCARSP